MTLKAYLAKVTREYIIRIARENDGSRIATASALGLKDKAIEYYIGLYDLGDHFGRRKAHRERLAELEARG